jgi:hypothetical protein
MSGVAEYHRLVKTLFAYAHEKREEGVCDFTEVLVQFHADVLRPLEEEYRDGRDSHGKRFVGLVKQYIQTDPRRQSRIESFYR